MVSRPFFLLYSPECVEGLFSEVRRHGVLGSSWGMKKGETRRPRPAGLVSWRPV